MNSNSDYSLSILKTALYGSDATVFNIIEESNIGDFFLDNNEANLYSVMLSFYRKTHLPPTLDLIKAYYREEGSSDSIRAILTQLKSKNVKIYKPEEFEGFVRLQNRVVVKDRLTANVEAMLEDMADSSLSELDENIDEMKTEIITGELSIQEEQNVERLIHTEVNAVDIFKQKYEQRKALGGKKVCNYGYDFIDEVTGGIKSTDLISIIGSAKQFKSTLLRNIGRNILKQTKNLLYITIEMSYSEIEDWFVTMIGNDKDRFPDGNRFTYKEVGEGTVEDEDALYDAYNDLAGADDLGVIYILKPSGMYTYDRFVGDLVRVENSFVDVDVIMIDSINLMEDTSREAINDLLRRIRQLTLSKNNNLGIPCISPFQINRQGFASACLKGTTKVRVRYTEKYEIEIKELEQLLKDNPFVLIETPDGWVKVNKFFNQGVKQLFKVTFDNNLEVICTRDHKIQTDRGMVALEDISNLDDNILTKQGYTKINHIVKASEEDTFDIEVNHENHRFYADGVVVSNCNTEGNLYTVDAIRDYAEVEMSSTNVISVIQTPEMRESKVIQVQHILSRETELFKPTKLSVDAEVGLIHEIKGGSEEIDYTTDETANEIVNIVSKNLF